MTAAIRAAAAMADAQAPATQAELLKQIKLNMPTTTGAAISATEMTPQMLEIQANLKQMLTSLGGFDPTQAAQAVAA